MAHRRRPTEADLRASRILLAGDAPELLEAARAGARHEGIEIVRFDERARPEDTSLAERPLLALVAVRREDGSLGRALALAEQLEPSLGRGAIAIAMTVAGVTRLAPRHLERLLAREVLYQLRAALDLGVGRRSWRTFRLRVGHGALRTAGVRVFRLGAVNT